MKNKTSKTKKKTKEIDTTALVQDFKCSKCHQNTSARRDSERFMHKICNACEDAKDSPKVEDFKDKDFEAGK